jgi:hypothetical protein
VQGALVASGAVPASIRPTSRRGLLAALVVSAMLAFAGCQVDVATTITIRPDGTGQVVQAVGFDDAAMARIGDLDQQLAVDDLEAAGWTVSEPERRDDAMTWVTATKEVADTTELAVAVSEISGRDGMLRDIAVGQSDAFLERTTEFEATVDLSRGAAIFTDPDLTAVPGDPYAALLAEIEGEEGLPLAEMVDVSVTVELPDGVTATVNPRLGDPSQPLSARSEESKLTERGLQALIVLVVVATGLVIRRAWVVRRRRTRRMMAGRYLRR